MVLTYFTPQENKGRSRSRYDSVGDPIPTCRRSPKYRFIQLSSFNRPHEVTL